MIISNYFSLNVDVSVKVMEANGHVMESSEKDKGSEEDEIEKAQQSLSSISSSVLEKLPKKLLNFLLPFQREGVEFAVGKNGRCLIADEMGLGKTIQALSVALLYKDEWPLLIIVPSALKFCWIEELEKWLPEILPQDINLLQCGSDASGIADSPITIATYGLLRLPSSKLIREAITARKFQVVICDESHYLKNGLTLSSKTVVPLIKSANRRILLSGTPALSKPVELYSQIDAICPGKFGTFWKFTDRYCDAHTVYYGKVRQRKVDGASNLEELQQRLQSMLMIRREKSSVLTQLPPKQRQRVLFELKQSSFKTEILDTFADLKGKLVKGDKSVRRVLQGSGPPVEPVEQVENCVATQDGRDMSVLSQISRLYRLSGEAKIGPVREYIEMLCENTELKFLVFAYHHNMMDGIQQTLWEKKVKFVRIDGQTKGIDRQAYVNQFQSDPSIQVAILSILAAGVGLTFTAAKLVVFAELYWTPGVMVQCEDRAHRIGQTSSLPVHYLVAKGTMDEWVWSAVCKKTIVTSTALTGKSKNLEHEEGDKYQIDILSNADIWQPDKEKDQANLDISALLESQRTPDQPSILNFFQSPSAKTPTTKGKASVPVKHAGIPVDAKMKKPATNSTSNKSKAKTNSAIFGKCQVSKTKGKVTKMAAEISSKASMEKKRKFDEIIVLSSDSEDGDFKSPLDRKKKKSKLKMKEEEKEIVTLSEKDSVCDTDLDQHFEPDVLTKEGQDIEKESTSISQNICGKDAVCEQVLDVSSKFGNIKQNENSDLSDDSLPDFSFISNKSVPKKPLSFKNVSSQDVKTNEHEEKVGKCNSTKQPKEQLKTEPEGESEVDGDEIKNDIEIGVGDQHMEIEDKCSENETTDKCNVTSESLLDEKDRLGFKVEIQMDCSNTEKLENTENAFVKLKPVSENGVSKKNQWPCDLCTFLNHSALRMCEMCDTPKKGKSVPSKHSEQPKCSAQKAKTCSRKLEIGSTSSERKADLDVVGEDSSDVMSHPLSFSPLKSSPNSSASDECCEDGNEPVKNLEQTDIADTLHNVCDPGSSSTTVLGSSDSKTLNKRCETPNLFDEEEEESQDTVVVLDQDTSAIKSSCDRVEAPCKSSDPQKSDDTKTDQSLHRTQYTCIKTGPSEQENHLETDTTDGGHSPKSNTASAQLLPQTDNHMDTATPVNAKNSGKSTAGPVYKLLKFSCSPYTGRIYVYDEDGNSLGANFLPLDLEVGNVTSLPDFLQQPCHLQLLARFVREWASLTDTKRRLIAKRNVVFSSPTLAYEEVKSLQGSKQRHLTKADAVAQMTKVATGIDGSVRLISKKTLPAADADMEEDGSLRGLAQAVTKEGAPICLQCHKPYSNSLLKSKTISNAKNAWQLRLCSAECMDKYWTLTKASYCRDQLFSLQHGVCQLCKMDAQDFFNRIKSTKDLTIRAELLNKSPFNKLSKKTRQKMVTQPVAGQFWHADHIVPVWQGGGMCDLDNLRTLCTPCHVKVTTKQAGQRATMKKLSGASRSHNISAFFQKS